MYFESFSKNINFKTFNKSKTLIHSDFLALATQNNSLGSVDIISNNFSDQNNDRIRVF